MDGSIVDSRIATSASRLDALRTEIDAWLVHRRTSDNLQQYASQIDTIEEILHRSVTAVGGTLPTIDGDRATVYEQCRTSDRRTVWIERVWRYFADRFGQRDDTGARGVCLRAADEAVWSCWRPAFAESRFDALPTLPGPVPLPFLDAVHAPEAFPVGQVPVDLSAVHADGDFVREHLSRLPVPTVRVPAAAAREPWQLALLAHEVGHHLQSAVGLVAPFRDAIGEAVRTAGGTAADVTRWTSWSIEIFADLVSVGLLGPWALWPIAELEWRLPSKMTSERGPYPPATVRLRLLAQAIRAVGFDPDPTWTVGAELPDDRFLQHVVNAGLRMGPPGLGLVEWTGLRTADFAPDGECAQWQEWFAGGPPPVTSPSLRAPRVVLAATVAATARARGADPAERAVLLDRVRDHAFDRMIALRAPERRAPDGRERGGRDVGVDLAEALATGKLPEEGGSP